MADYNVVKDYDWTSAPRGSGIRKSAPRVWVKSYKLTSNQIMTMVEGYLAIKAGADQTAEEFYNKMYGDVTKGEDNFNFPYFNDSVRSFNNNFGDTFQNGFGESGGIGTAANELVKGFLSPVVQLGGAVGMDNINKAVDQAKNRNISGAFSTLIGGIKGGGDPGTYVETPMFYQFGKDDTPLQVSFVLSNTINADSIKKNHNLIMRLTYINRPFRKNSIAVDPPRIYKVKVPGHRFIRWAYCSAFSVEMLGARRNIGEIIIPEGYKIDMTFTSLTMEHGGFLKQAQPGGEDTSSSSSNAQAIADRTINNIAQDLMGDFNALL